MVPTVPSDTVPSTTVPSDMVVPTTVLMEDGTPVPRSEAEQAMCDCELTRIVTDAADVPINLGRTQRLYTGAMRRAVIARDHSCRWPGCHHPARWCEIHHIRWWDRHGGDTSLTNGILLCPYHHHEVHRRDLDITRITPTPPRLGPLRGTPPETETRTHLDELGAARYRFTDPEGRLVAGPTWDRPDMAGGSADGGAGAGAGAHAHAHAHAHRAATGDPPSAATPRSSADVLRAATTTGEASTLWSDEVDVRTATTPVRTEPGGPTEPTGRRQQSPRVEPAHRAGLPGRVESPRSPRMLRATHEAAGPAPPR